MIVRGASATRRVFGLAAWALSWALALAAVVLAVSFGLPRQPLPGLVLSTASEHVLALFPSIGLAVSLVYGPVAALLLFRRANAVGVILAVHALGSALSLFGSQWALLGAQHEGLPLWGALAFASGWAYVPGTFMTAVLPILVTRARIPGWQRAIVGAGATTAIIATFAALVHQTAPTPTNPLALRSDSLQAVLPIAYELASVAAVLLSAVSAAIVLWRWRVARGAGRSGLAWLATGHVFLSLGYAMLVLPAGLAPAGSIAGSALVVPVLGQIIYPAAILVVVLGQGLWGQRTVISRMVLWAMLTVSGIVIYLGIVLLAPGLLPWPDGLRLAVPLLLALAIEPVRGWLQRRIDELIYGEGSDPETLFERLGERIGELEPGEAGLRELCEALRRELRLGSVQLRSETSGIVASAGTPAGPVVRIALPGEQPAELVVTAPGGQRLDRRSISLLRDLGGFAAAVLHLVESNRRLDLVRDELVTRRARERRSIQRELHDGLGPALAGLGFGLAAVGNLLPRDERAAAALLDELEADLARRARTVRRLAAEVSPSPLDGATLDRALAELAERFDGERLAVEALVPAPAAAAVLPQAQQDATYFIAAEALTNTARHSGAGRASIELTIRRDELVLRIADDGAGLPAQRPTGIGLASMRHRAERLGGSLSIECSGGTVVTAVLPLPPVLQAGTPASDEMGHLQLEPERAAGRELNER